MSAALSNHSVERDRLQAALVGSLRGFAATAAPHQESDISVSSFLLQNRTLKSMKESVHLVHPNGNHRIVKMGFCWVGFFLPSLWSISEGLWRPFAFTAFFVKLMSVSSEAATEFEQRSLADTALILNITTVICALAYLLTMIFCGIYGKKWLVDRLMKQGYVDHIKSRSIISPVEAGHFSGPGM